MLAWQLLSEITYGVSSEVLNIARLLNWDTEIKCTRAQLQLFDR